jgi:hypothetical protein
VEYGFRQYGANGKERSQYLLDLPIYTREQIAPWPGNSLKNIKQWAIPKGTTLLEGRTAAIEYTRSGYKPPYPIKPGQDFGYPGGARQKVIADPSILYEP